MDVQSRSSGSGSVIFGVKYDPMDAVTLQIDVRFFATLRLKSGRKQATWRGERAPAVREIVRWLETELGIPVWDELIDENDGIRPGTMLLVGGKNVHHLDGLDTVVDTDRLDVFPPAGGG